MLKTDSILGKVNTGLLVKHGLSTLKLVHGYFEYFSFISLRGGGEGLFLKFHSFVTHFTSISYRSESSTGRGTKVYIS